MAAGRLFALAVAVSLLVVAVQNGRAALDPAAVARGWANTYFGPRPAPPFSLQLGGRPVSALVSAWKFTRTESRIDRNRTRVICTWRDRGSGLSVRCVSVLYRDFPTVEWIIYVKNEGGSDTPPVDNLQPLDVQWNTAGRADYVLHHNIGSLATKSDYAPLVTPLPPGAAKRISAAGGRPTNSDMSYFNLEWRADGGSPEGAIVVVGWPGQWAAEFARPGGEGIHISAGQENTHFVLHPGEEVRTPLMVLQAWKGDWLAAQNVWRRWMVAHNVPRPGGKLPPPQLVASSSRAYEEMKGANEANQIMHIDRYGEERIKLDYWWMDAGWYVQEKGWPQVGTWEVDTKRFPHGFRAISDHAHQKGVKILVWFEPERVAPDTWLANNHPEWLLSSNPDRARALAGLVSRRSSELGGADPCVSRNTSDHSITMAAIRWDPGRLSLHPGPKGEYSVVRWTAPRHGEYRLDAAFAGIDEKTTTDVHVLHDGESLFDGFINLNAQGRRAAVNRTVALRTGDTIDFVVGYGNGSHFSDSTGLDAILTGPDGVRHDAAASFSVDRNPNGEWSYGYLVPGPRPDVRTFRLYDRQGRAESDEHRLLNLGNPDAWHWLVEHVDRLLTENGIDLYRQDFNIDPIAFWRANDPSDRQGITENRYATGYIAYWDELRRRHPNMLIDSCASGGRRNDLETMRRAVPLWRSDYAYEATGHQCMTYGISMWLPYHGTGTVATASAPYYGGGVTPVEPYAFWSNTAPSLGLGIDIREKGLDYDALRALIVEWRELNRFYYADFYPLTPYTLADDAWIAWQLNRPEQGDGAVQAFRRPKSAVTAMRLRLQGLDSRARYRVRSAGTASALEQSGRTLMEEGVEIHSPVAPGAVVLFYEKLR